MRIRTAVPADRPALYAIALATGDAGEDAAHLHRHPDLIGDIWVGPYLTGAPEHAFVLVDDDDRPAGYVLGTHDTRAFEAWMTGHWWPGLRERLADLAEPTAADEAIIERIRHPAATPEDVIRRFPAHGHIDLLPRAQGMGFGRELLTTVMASLARAGASGMHLEVGRDNVRARSFYERLGFAPIRSTTESVFLGSPLTPR